MFFWFAKNLNKPKNRSGGGTVVSDCCWVRLLESVKFVCTFAGKWFGLHLAGIEKQFQISQSLIAVRPNYSANPGSVWVASLLTVRGCGEAGVVSIACFAFCFRAFKTIALKWIRNVTVDIYDKCQQCMLFVVVVAFVVHVVVCLCLVGDYGM